MDLVSPTGGPARRALKNFGVELVSAHRHRLSGFRITPGDLAFGGGSTADDGLLASTLLWDSGTPAEWDSGTFTLWNG